MWLLGIQIARNGIVGACCGSYRKGWDYVAVKTAMANGGIKIFPIL